MEEYREYKEYKVFSAKLTRKLLTLGYTIVDIVPNDNASSRTVFVFRNDKGLIDEIEKYKLTVYSQNK